MSHSFHGFSSYPTGTPGVFDNTATGDFTIVQPPWGELRITFNKHRVTFTLEAKDGYYEGSIPLVKTDDGYQGDGGGGGGGGGGGYIEDKLT
jgi:hypothetical protein